MNLDLIAHTSSSSRIMRSNSTQLVTRNLCCDPISSNASYSAFFHTRDLHVFTVTHCFPFLTCTKCASRTLWNALASEEVKSAEEVDSWIRSESPASILFICLRQESPLRCRISFKKTFVQSPGKLVTSGISWALIRYLRF